MYKTDCGGAAGGKHVPKVDYVICERPYITRILIKYQSQVNNYNVTFIKAVLNLTGDTRKIFVSENPTRRGS